MPNFIRRLWGIIFKPRKGRMSRDLDQRYLMNGDFTNSLNTRSTTNTGNSTADREIVRGNDRVFNIPAVATSNKVCRVYLDSTTTDARTFKVFTPNNVQVGASATWIPTVGNLAQTYHDATNTAVVTSIGHVLQAAGQTFTIGALVSLTTNTGYFTLEIRTVSFWDYYVTLTSAFNDVQPLIIQEAIDFSISGNVHIIGSYDLDGELIIWSTTQEELPSQIPIINISNDTGVILVEVEDTTLLQQLGLVTISGITNNAGDEANGSWIISIVDATHFRLLGSVYGGTYTLVDPQITINPIGYGLVGRAVKDENNQSWTYNTIIASRVFNFVTKHQIKSYCEKSAVKKSYYWTDDYNVPRVLYDFTQVYQNNCLLTYIDPLNTYSYNTLGIESILILSTTDLVFSFTGQTQAGGAVPSGNSRYTIRLVSESNTYTDWLPLSNPIPAAVTSEAVAGGFFWGDVAGTPTGKINNFLLSGSILGIFKFVELGWINYLDSGTGSYNSAIVSRSVVTGDTMQLQHTGKETSYADLDPGTVGKLIQTYSRAKNIDSLSGRLILSNLETTPQVDLADYFASLTYSVAARTVTPATGSFINGGYSTGEYELSENVYESAGYMINEQYRLGAMVEWQYGGFSNVYWIDDFTMDRNAVGRKSVDASFASYDLTDGNLNVFSFYVKLNISDTAVINGVVFKDVVKRVYIMRCPVNTPSIIASGIAIPSCTGYYRTVIGGSPVDAGSLEVFDYLTHASNHAEWFCPGDLFENYLINHPTYQDETSGLNNLHIDRAIAALYFPDLFMGNTAITPIVNSDKILNFGQFKFSTMYDFSGQLGNYLYEDYNVTPLGVGSFDTLNVAEMKYVDRAGSVTLSTGDIYWKKIFYKYEQSSAVANMYFDNPAGWVVRTDTAGGFKLLTGITDHALYHIQYQRPISFDDQYGQKITSVYMWTGAIYTTGVNATSVDVFGGDTLTQKCWYKNRYPEQNNPATNPATEGFGQGLGFYCQNRINFQMRSTIPTEVRFPVFNSLQAWVKTVPNETLIYNTGYNASVVFPAVFGSVAAFNPDPEAANNDFPVRIAYSNNKIPESAQDQYRVFNLLSFKDLDYKNGEVVHHAIANGELVTWQNDITMRQYLNPTGMLKTSVGDEIVLGDGAVLQRKGQVLTGYGTVNGFSVILGKSEGGDDVYYYVDTNNRAVFRMHLFGDGTVNIGIVHGMDSWWAENLRFVDGIDTPADGRGICGVWNERNKEAIFTVRGWYQTEEWTNAAHYRKLFDFNSLTTTSATGDQPTASMTIANTGTVTRLFGITQMAGQHSGGTIYSFDPVTNTFVRFYDFGTIVNDGLNPTLQELYYTINSYGRCLYGTTAFGGTGSAGIIFRAQMNPSDASFALYVKLYDFGSTGVALTPSGGLFFFSGDNKFYGVASTDSGSGFGAVYSLDDTGGSPVYADRYVFTGATGDGSSPNGTFVNIASILYGVTQFGGNGLGNIYSFDPSGNVYTNLHSFNGAGDGEFPIGSLFVASDGNLYGTTSSGGVGGHGTFFKFNTGTNTFTLLYSFNGGAFGGDPMSKIVEFLPGRLTFTEADGGANSVGTAMYYDIASSTMRVLHNFSDTTGSVPIGGIISYNGSLYGNTQLGGANSVGVIYSMTPRIYSIGDVVWYGTVGFEEIPQLYVSLINNNYNLQPDVNPLAWTKIDITDNNYYNIYTLVFNEVTNGFDTFYSFHPKIYLGYKNTYLSPVPIDDEGRVYEHGKGDYAVWYDTLIEDGFYESVVNAMPDDIKSWMALRFRTDVAPFRVDVFTSAGQHTYMLAADFTFREMNYDGEILNDIITSPNGLPTGDGNKLWGDSARIKLTFHAQQYQRLYEYITRVETRSRNNQS